MRSTLLRLAQPVQLSARPLDPSVRAAQSTLLPPVPLYRHLLRIHRRLPLEMRSLGDDYVKAEFQRHKTADNPVHIMGFLLEWNKYLSQLQTHLVGDSSTFRGVKMEDPMFEKMSNEQLGQLYELMHASKDVWKPAEPHKGLKDVSKDEK